MVARLVCQWNHVHRRQKQWKQSSPTPQRLLQGPKLSQWLQWVSGFREAQLKRFNRLYRHFIFYERASSENSFSTFLKSAQCYFVQFSQIFLVINIISNILCRFYGILFSFVEPPFLQKIDFSKICRKNSQIKGELRNTPTTITQLVYFACLLSKNLRGKYCDSRIF